MLTAAAAKTLPFLTLAILFVAVTWETVHVVDWCITLFERAGDGTAAGYLRMHAYTYITFVFGDVGWTLN